MEKIVISEELQLKLNSLDNEIAQEILKAEINTEEKYINYLGLSEKVEGNISYTPKDRILRYSEEEYWLPHARVHSKPGKVAELLFPKKFTQRQVEIFAEEYKGLVKQDCIDCSTLYIVEGEKIKWCYYYANYTREGHDCNSGLNGSCMRGSDCQNFFDIYCKNTKHVGMAVLYDEEEKVRCRCILWYPQGKVEGGEVWYDRIYGNSNKTHEEMQAILERKGFINVSEKNILKPKETKNRKIVLDYGYESIDNYPYMDTFYFLDGNTIGNYSFSDDCYTMQCTGGGIDEPEDRPCCSNCGDRSDDLHYIARGYNRGDERCDDCAYWSDAYDSWIATSEAVELENGDYVLEEDAIEDYRRELIYEGESVELYNGKYAHEDDDDLQSTDEGEYFIEGDENFVEIDNRWYFKGSSDLELIGDQYFIIGSDSYENALQLMELENK